MHFCLFCLLFFFFFAFCWFEQNDRNGPNDYMSYKDGRTLSGTWRNSDSKE